MMVNEKKSIIISKARNVDVIRNGRTLIIYNFFLTAYYTDGMNQGKYCINECDI